MSKDDLEYYRRRLAEEEARAFEAGSDESRAAHRRLAILYWEKIELLKMGASLPLATNRDTGSPARERRENSAS